MYTYSQKLFEQKTAPDIAYWIIMCKCLNENCTWSEIIKLASSPTLTKTFSHRCHVMFHVMCLSIFIVLFNSHMQIYNIFTNFLSSWTTVIWLPLLWYPCLIILSICDLLQENVHKYFFRIMAKSFTIHQRSVKTVLEGVTSIF